MSNLKYYEVMIESEMGRRISEFWNQCMKAEQEAEKYAKSMGAVTYYENPNMFAGGCLCVAFMANAKVDLGVWREAGHEQDGTRYYCPNVETRTGEVEIPHRDYALKDTYCRLYKRDQIRERDGKLMVPYLEFYREESPIGTNGQKRTASNGLRKAIKAEMKRRKLPVVPVTRLLAILGATVPTPTLERTETTTPTFFPYQQRYFIGTEYTCQGEGLVEITPQLYRMNRDKYMLEQRRGA